MEYLCKDAAGEEFSLSVAEDLAPGTVCLLTHDQVADAMRAEVVEEVAKEYVAKPYPNEHACRLAAPGRFQAFRRSSRQSDGKPYSIIWGQLPGGGKWEEQAYRYPAGPWDAPQAKAHCQGHQGKSFEPATRGEGKAGKSAPVAMSALIQKSRRVAVFKARDEEKRLVYGVALEPMAVDTWLDFETAETIEETAHNYLLAHRGVGVEHEREIKSAPVESYIAPVDFWFEGTPQNEDTLVRKGSWVLVVKVLDDDEWARVKDGTYTGFSIQGQGKRRPVELMVEEEEEAGTMVAEG